MNNYYLYKHICPKGKIYIGITKQEPHLRWKNGHGYSDNQYFTRAIKKYGWDNFKHEIIYSKLTKEEAENKEKNLISFYKSNIREFGYNIQKGGSVNEKHSEETKRKISQSLMGIKNPRYGKNFKGYSLSEEIKRKLSISHKGQIPVNKCAVLQFDKNKNLINKFETMLEASIKTKTNISNISRCCNKKTKTANGYI